MAEFIAAFILSLVLPGQVSGINNLQHTRSQPTPTFTMLQKKTVLITGCSQGSIGEALARAFVAKDFHVFATLRNTSKARTLAELDGVEIIQLDVTSTDSIKTAAKVVAERTNGTLDVLINNAGQDFVMPLLDAPLEDVKKLYDINVWSILATTQVFASLLIKSKGTLCNICSTAACMPFAYAGVNPFRPNSTRPSQI